MKLTQYFKQLQLAQYASDIEEICQSFASELDFKFFHAGVVHLASLVHPPVRCISNLNNNSYPYKEISSLIQQSYTYSEPLVLNRGLYTLRDICHAKKRFTCKAVLLPVHTTMQHFVLFSLHHKSGCSIPPSKLFSTISQAAVFADQLAFTLIKVLSPYKVQENPLKQKEHRFLALAAAGKPYEEIAGMHKITSCTVSYHIKRAKNKLNAKTRSQAVAKASLMGYFKAKL